MNTRTVRVLDRLEKPVWNWPFHRLLNNKWLEAVDKSAAVASASAYTIGMSANSIKGGTSLCDVVKQAASAKPNLDTGWGKMQFSQRRSAARVV